MSVDHSSDVGVIDPGIDDPDACVVNNYHRLHELAYFLEQSRAQTYVVALRRDILNKNIRVLIRQTRSIQSLRRKGIDEHNTSIRRLINSRSLRVEVPVKLKVVGIRLLRERVVWC